MPSSRFLSCTRWVMVSLFAILWLAGSVNAAQPDGDAAAPHWEREFSADARLAGEGKLRFLGLRIYDARLWVAPGFQAEAFDVHPFVLQLTYHRAFTGADIARRSIEEIRRQVDLSGAQAERWRQALATLIPDVQPGDRLTGIYKPGEGMQLWRGNQPLGGLRDAELARFFFGIWLSPSSSEPGLRKDLLGHTLGSP